MPSDINNPDIIDRNLSPISILLVDDEEDIRDVLGIYLKDLGYDVSTAENGEEALAIFAQHKQMIVLSDIKMPGMDGIELLKRIKEMNPDTEVIMITGHGDMELAIKSLKFEAIDFITKPINDDVLDIALKRAQERISMRRQIRTYTENLEKLVEEKTARVIELERQVAVGQALEGLTSLLKNISSDLESGETFFNEMPCFVSIHNKDLKIVATNQLFKERIGDKIGKSSWEIYKIDSTRDYKGPVAETFQTGIGKRSKEIVVYANGTESPVIVHTAPIRSRGNEVELVLELSVDISEIKRIQEELRTTQQRYQQLFDEAPCYISVQDKEFNIVNVNKRFSNDFGKGIGSKCYEIYKHRHEPCNNCPVAKTFEDGQSHQTEMVVTSSLGEQYDVLIWTAPLYDASGNLTHVMEMSTNITQIRKLQDHLSTLGFLITTISHGIKGILTGLDGGMYLVHSGFAKENMKQIQEGWEIVKLMVGRIRSMVLDILYFAKKRELKWEKTDVISFANDVALMIESKIRTHQIEFIKEFDPQIGEFEIDPGILRSALINILENAIDACVMDKTKSSHTIRFCVTQEENDIIFDVYDNGIGMDKETLENLFTLFFSSKGHMGTGLGLFISNKIIQQHGGSIKVSSTYGQGSHFRVRMPKVPSESIKVAQLELTPSSSD